MIHTRYFWHALNCYFNFTNDGIDQQLITCGEVLADGILNIGKRILF